MERLELHRGPNLPEDLLHRVDQLWPDAVARDQGALELLLLLVQLVGLDLGEEARTDFVQRPAALTAMKKLKIFVKYGKNIQYIVKIFCKKRIKPWEGKKQCTVK